MEDGTFVAKGSKAQLPIVSTFQNSFFCGKNLRFLVWKKLTCFFSSSVWVPFSLGETTCGCWCFRRFQTPNFRFIARTEWTVMLSFHRNLNNYFNLFQMLLTMRHKVGDIAFLIDSEYHLMLFDCLIGSRDTHDTPKHHSFSSWHRITNQPSLLDPFWFRLLAQTTHAKKTHKKPLWNIQGGPLLVINWVINPCKWPRTHA